MVDPVPVRPHSRFTFVKSHLVDVDSGGAKILVKRYVLVLGSLHLTLMAALGLWLWLDLQVFGLGNQQRDDFRSANTYAVKIATVAIMGQAVPLGSPVLRLFSLAIYSLFLMPGINLIAPMILFLAVYFGCRRIPFAKKWESLPAYMYQSRHPPLHQHCVCRRH